MLAGATSNSHLNNSQHPKNLNAVVALFARMYLPVGSHFKVNTRCTI
jgi:hypothetical protein